MTPARLMSVLSGVVIALSACGGDDDGDGTTRQDAAEFIALAESGACAEDVNRIYRIDGEQVLWHREDLGCADAAYAVTLYGTTPDDELCRNAQTIAGPVTECRAAEFRSRFDVILDNLDAADLGLGDDHRVELVWEG